MERQVQKGEEKYIGNEAYNHKGIAKISEKRNEKRGLAIFNTHRRHEKQFKKDRIDSLVCMNR